MRTIPISALVLVAFVVLPVSAAGERGAGSAVRWLERAQNPDGGFPATPGGPSSAAITGWASLGLEGAGHNPLDLRRGGRSPIGFMRANLDGIRSTGDLERTVLAIDGAGISARRFGGRDLVAQLRGRRSPDGSFEGQVNLTAFGILALRAAGSPASALARSAAWLRRAQNGNGGWGFQPRAGSDPDSTGAALQGLAAAGARGRATRRGRAYLRRAQRGDGGFALAGASTSNSQSTAWAVQGLLAAGANPAAVRSGGQSPMQYLARRQAADGHYRYSSASDQTPVWVTAQALLAVYRRAFPLASVPRAAASSRGDGAGAPGGSVNGGAAAQRGAPAARPGGGPPSAPGGPARTEGDPNGAGPGGPAGVAARPVSAPLATPDAPAPGDGSASVEYVAGGFALLIAALGGGFLWYRRRLP